MIIAEKNELIKVVVIGYGTVKKSDLTGSVVSVKADELKAVPQQVSTRRCREEQQACKLHNYQENLAQKHP
jgi:hypothetical protein